MEEDSFLDKPLKPTPNAKASLCSKLFFCWAPVYFYKRYKKNVLEERYAPLKSHKSQHLGNKLEMNWEHEFSTNANPSLWRVIYRTFRLEFCAIAAFFVCSEFALKMTQPWLIESLISQYEITNSTKVVSKNECYSYGFLILLTTFLGVISTHFYQLQIQHLGMKIRIALASLIYRKTLRINAKAAPEFSSGKMINLLSNDINRFDLAPMHFLQLLISPIETAFVIFYLYFSVGLTALAGIVFLLLFIPAQMYMGTLTAQYRRKTAVKTDQRVKLMNEIISGSQVIKVYTSEKMFSDMISKARNLEMGQIMNTSYIRALNISSMLFMNRTGIFLSIVISVLVEKRISAQYVFVVSSFYAILRQTLTVYFPFGLQNFSETKVSVERIKTFLLTQQVPPRIGLGQKVQPVGINLENVCVKYTNASDPVLKNVNFKAGPNELVIIRGTVGCGKSTLLQVILNEFPTTEGKREVKGSISHAAQEPWLFYGTVRQNILFGARFDSVKYRKVVEMCALDDDFATFPQNDTTVIGERGALLSGGQRARISLARALYKDSDIYLLDGPFASVDAKVGKTIFQKVVLEYLKDKCVVLVTHHVQYLPWADRIYLINDGEVTIDKVNKDVSLLETQTEELKPPIGVDEAIKSEEKAKQEELKESPKRGSVSFQVYKKYMHALGGFPTHLLLTALFLLTQMGASGVDYFLAFWLNINQFSRNQLISNQTCIYIYSGIIIATIILSITRSICFFKYCLKASTNLHNNMFSKLIHAPMSFFKSTPSGVVLNRFSKDVGIVDETLPLTMINTFQVTLIILGSLILIALVNSWMLIPLLAIAALFYFLKTWYLATSQNLQRLEATARSPVYSHMNSSMQGLTTIRIHRAEQALEKEFDRHQDVHSAAFYTFLITNRAFGFWLDLNCFFYTVVVVIVVVSLETSVGNIGLGITQSLNMIGILQWGVRQWSDLQNQMISVERMVEYTTIKSENEKTDTKEVKSWPKGQIEFKTVSLRYPNSSRLSLDNVSFTIHAGDKIGVVGRTGAGKSSLVSALLRLYDYNGTILIDDVDIKSIALKQLRSKISVIPQEPVLFTGTLRQNLDPYEATDDAKLWEVLDQLNLKNLVSGLGKGLYEEISEGGVNFSIGQRQLICLARAILRNNPIFVLDEATANIDIETDACVRLNITKYFQNCTIITVAHRDSTIMDSDKILVVDDGKVVEFDRPENLLKNKDSVFVQFVNESEK